LHRQPRVAQLARIDHVLRAKVIFFGAGIAAAFPNGVGLGRKVYPRPLVGIVQARR
jgi:hypothetical protein